MNIFVISLADREDRRSHIYKHFNEYNYEIVDAVNGYSTDFEKIGIKPFRKWIDPLLERTITPGEIGCAVSHINVWKKIAEQNLPAIILEDDSKFCNYNGIESSFNFEEIDEVLNKYDMVYLGYKEMSSKSIEEVKLNETELVVPIYPYHTNAYAITPNFAKYLLSLNYNNYIVPVDEFFSIVNGIEKEDYLSESEIVISNFNFLKEKFFKEKRKIAAFKTPVITQVSREELGSDIENKISFGSFVHATVGTDEAKMNILFSSLLKNYSQVLNLGKNKQWTGGDVTNGPGGGQKVNLFYEFLNTQSDNSIILFTDAYDVFLVSSIDGIVNRFLEFKCDVLFSAEKTCWPDPSLSKLFPDSFTNYKFLNSGCFIGYRWALLRLIESQIKDTDDDQLYYQKQYLKSLTEDFINIKLDTENYIFQCLGGSENSVKVLENGQLYNSETNCCPLVLHGNGGPYTKQVFKDIFNAVYKDITIMPSTSKLSVVGPDIISGDFLNVYDSYEIINMAERAGKWKSMDGDKFPGQEIRIKEFSPQLFKIIEDHIMNVIAPAIEKHWFPLEMYGVRDMFIIKYNKDSQSYLPCHLDASLVSGIIKLNGEYTGGETYFHRQDYSNANVNVGDIILWPGQVTHGHEGRPVTSGTKYNLVIWTSRFPGDVNE